MAWFERSYSRILVDNHISELRPEYMADFSPEDYANKIAEAGVDASMIYATDHNGNCYYRTRVGHMHSGLQGRDVFEETVQRIIEKDITPLAYHSVVFYNHAAQEHPDWRMDLPGGVQRNGRYWYCCPNSLDYRDFCAEQCAEIVSYPVDGIFIDMVFWPGICLCHNCRTRYLEEESAEIPTVIQWNRPEWVGFQRARERWMGEFAEFLTAACNSANPLVTVTQQFSPVILGWSFGQSPTIANACNYSSGDFYGGRYHQSLALKAMDAFSVEKPYEFFTSRCVNLFDHTSMKSKEQMMCSAAATLANGGSFVLIDAINPDGTLCPEVYQRMRQVTDDLRPYLDLMQDVRPTLAADLGVYFSMPSHVDRTDSGKDYTQTGSSQSNMTPSSDLPPIRELLATSTMLCRSHIPYRLIRSDKPDFTGINTLIINDCAYMSEEEVAAVTDFVASGGNLIATGCTSLYDLQGNSSGDFALSELFGVSYTGEFSGRVNYCGYDGKPDKHTGGGSRQYVVADIPAPLVNATTARQLADLVGTYTDPDDPDHFASIHSNPPAQSLGHPCITLNNYGDGLCLYVASNIFARETSMHRVLCRSLVRDYGNVQTVISTNAPDCVELTLLECQNGDWLLALVNCQEQLPNVPARDVSVKLRLPGDPKIAECTLVSSNKPITSMVEGDIIEVILDNISTIEVVRFVCD